ncbi:MULTISPECIES: tape measure protein [Hyphomicrobiales]|uniref:tape measure protein n=1 Tax=Hyphomicrobiales TaxID=356 RepID=UPI001BCF042C|nr:MULTISPECIES: tape measure protein [Hyphomicrobiales]CAH1662789.1 conserved membrane hypothetical protein [Hyphomicrobiales bacterium]MBS7741480.1 tape measure protein [Chelatococcus sp. HY11]MBX3491209.1 tape measure protein [Parvibaculum sp.]MBX3544501.1 tape measure protein [Chelatococcus sp.]MCO5078976.1 tape measure protein [Chelatococcus sp.]
MAIALSSLRVSADLDASGYARGMKEKTDADAAGVRSSQQVGQALAQQDAALGKADKTVSSLSRQYIEGYSKASQMEKAIKQLGSALDRGAISGERAEATYAGITRKYGTMANAAAIASRGHTQLASVVTTVNARLAVQAGSADAASAALSRSAERTRAAAAANDNIGRSFNQVLMAAQAAVPGLDRFSMGLSGIGGLVGGVAAVAGAVAVAGGAIAAAGDQYTRYGNLLQAAGVSAQQLGDRQQMLVDLALNTRTALEPTVTLYAGLSRSTQELGKTQQDVARATETINKAFKLGGVSAESAAGAILQLNQAMAAGALRGDELNSVLEGAPPLARLIAKEFGVGIGELKKLGEEGRLSASRVFDAIVKGSDDIDSAFRGSKVTMKDAATNGVTAFTELGAALDQVLGISASVAGALSAIANEVHRIAAGVRAMPGDIELKKIQGLLNQAKESQSPAGRVTQGLAAAGGLWGADLSGAQAAAEADRLIQQRIRGMLGVLPEVKDFRRELEELPTKTIDAIARPTEGLDDISRNIDRTFAPIKKLADANRELEKTSQDAVRNGLRPFDRAVSDAQKSLEARKKTADEMRAAGVAEADVNIYLAKSQKTYAQEVANATAAAAKSGSARSAANRTTSDSYDRLLDRLHKSNADMQIELATIGASTEEVLKLKTARELEREAIASKRPLTADMLRQIDEEAGRYARLKTEIDETRRAQDALNDAQNALGEMGVDILKSLTQGAGSFAEALGRASSSLQDMLINAAFIGQGPLAGLFGMQANQQGQTGGVFGMLMGNDIKAFRSAVSDGTRAGLKGFANDAASSGDGSNPAFSLFGMSGKQLLQGVVGVAAIASSYSMGQQAGSPMMGAASGALSGGLGGASLATAILGASAMAGPVGWAIAGAAALIGGGAGAYGGPTQRKKDRDHVRAQYRREYAARLAA